MRYENTVEIYIVDGSKQKLEDIITKTTSCEPDAIECTYEIGKNSDDENVLHMKFEQITWRKESKIVKYFNKLMDSLEEEKFTFARLGQTLEDVDLEQRGEYCYITLDMRLDVSGVDFELID